MNIGKAMVMNVGNVVGWVSAARAAGHQGRFGHACPDNWDITPGEHLLLGTIATTSKGEWLSKNQILLPISHLIGLNLPPSQSKSEAAPKVLGKLETTKSESTGRVAIARWLGGPAKRQTTMWVDNGCIVAVHRSTLSTLWIRRRDDKGNLRITPHSLELAWTGGRWEMGLHILKSASSSTPSPLASCSIVHCHRHPLNLIGIFNQN